MLTIAFLEPLPPLRPKDARLKIDVLIYHISLHIYPCTILLKYRIFNTVLHLWSDINQAILQNSNIYKPLQTPVKNSNQRTLIFAPNASPYHQPYSRPFCNRFNIVLVLLSFWCSEDPNTLSISNFSTMHLSLKMTPSKSPFI